MKDIHLAFSFKGHIPESMMSFFEQSQSPCGCRDKEGRFIYANNSYFQYFKLEEFKDSLLESHASYEDIEALAPIATQLKEHDRYVFETGQFHEAIGGVMIKGTIQIFMLFKLPFFIENKIVGTFFWIRDFINVPVRYFLKKEQYGVVRFTQPNNLLTEREWEVLFLLYRRIERVEMADLLGISDSTLKNHISKLLRRTHTLSTEELLEKGVYEGWHLFVPPRFLRDFVGSYQILPPNLI